MTYMVTYLELPKSAAIAGVLIASVAQFFLTPLVGALSDRIGRRPLYFTGAVGVGLWGFVFFPLIDTENPALIAAAIFVGLIFTTLMYAPQAAMFSELFGTSVRYSGASLGYQLASVFAGGLAPFIAVSLLGTVEERNTVAVSVYLAILAVLTVVAVCFAKETKGSSLEHDRVLDEALQK
jgi:MFS family permease